MISLNKLLEMICLESSIEQIKDLPPIRYDLELIERDGKLEWVEMDIKDKIRLAFENHRENLGGELLSIMLEIGEESISIAELDFVNKRYEVSVLDKTYRVRIYNNRVEVT